MSPPDFGFPYFQCPEHRLREINEESEEGEIDEEDDETPEILDVLDFPGNSLWSRWVQDQQPAMPTHDFGLQYFQFPGGQLGEITEEILEIPDASEEPLGLQYFPFPGRLLGEINMGIPDASEDPLLVKQILESVCESIGLDEGEGTESSCSICQEAFNHIAAGKGKGNGNADVKRSLLRLPCSHLFHSHCISEWLHRKLSCPICRTRPERRP